MLLLLAVLEKKMTARQGRDELIKKGLLEMMEQGKEKLFFFINQIFFSTIGNGSIQKKKTNNRTNKRKILNPSTLKKNCLISNSSDSSLM